MKKFSTAFLAATTTLVVFPITGVSALSSVSLPTPSSRSSPSSLPHQQQQDATSSSQDAVANVAPWRVVLDIGREPLSSMPFDWARSGCRMPLKINCDMHPSGLVVPQEETVSFTGPDGAVVSPIVGGNWELSSENDKKKSPGQELTMTLEFPKQLQRRDVTIEAGTTIKLTGRIFSQQELDRLNQEFYNARDQVWDIGGELNEMADKQGAPKKWNEEKQQWEKRYKNPFVLSEVSKRLSLMGAEVVKNQKANQRPDPKSLSDGRGTFPGMEDLGGAYIQKGGIVSIPGGGGWRGDAVIGTWLAEPITNTPASYRN